MFSMAMAGPYGLSLTLWDPSTLLSREAAPCCLVTDSVPDSQFLHTLADISHLFCSSRRNRRAVSF